MYVMAEMLHPLLDARSDAGQTLRARGSRIAARLLGGMSEWLKETGCKPVGYAYAGSNPAPPIIEVDAADRGSPIVSGDIPRAWVRMERLPSGRPRRSPRCATTRRGAWPSWPGRTTGTSRF